MLFKQSQDQTVSGSKFAYCINPDTAEAPTWYNFLRYEAGADFLDTHTDEVNHSGTEEQVRTEMACAFAA